jgi:hypothetical protein
MAEPFDELYGLPLEDFTPARDAAARELRRSGHRDAAAQLAKRRKPSPAAWAANQVARGRPELLAALLEAGEALREAQAKALAGGGGAELRDAVAAERRAVDAFLAAAGEQRPAGRALSRALVDRLRATLHAVAGDEAVREALAAGRLVGEAEASGAWPAAAFGAAEPLTPAEPEPEPAPPPAPKRRRPPRRGDERAAKAEAEAEAERRAEEERRRAEEQAAAEARAAEERRELERRLREARAALKVRERALERAEHDAAEAAQRLEAALAAVEDARAETDAAGQAQDEARAALEAARDDVARLAERLD